MCFIGFSTKRKGGGERPGITPVIEASASLKHSQRQITAFTNTTKISREELHLAYCFKTRHKGANNNTRTNKKLAHIIKFENRSLHH